MNSIVLEVAVPASLLLWSVVLLLPWRPWSVRERLEPLDDGPSADLSGITVVIPARDEAAAIGRTVTALDRQGHGLPIIVVDDQSRDGTGEIAASAAPAAVTVIPGAPLSSGWTGKLWALEQAREQVHTPLMLLLDADIELQPGMAPALLEHMTRGRYTLVSVMARLRMESFWERLLMPPFIWFFRLLYPFRLANRPTSRIAAAAGGCILVETRWLADIGGFAALRGAMIDDCTLAARIKRLGGTTWIGLTHGAVSHRSYDRLGDVFEMVARTAFAQLRYSWLLLGICTLAMLVAFPVPWAGLIAGDATTRTAGAVAILLSLGLFLPTLRYYRLPYVWAAGLPLAGTLYLVMTLAAAYRHGRGTQARWRGRTYRAPEPGSGME